MHISLPLPLIKYAPLVNDCAILLSVCSVVPNSVVVGCLGNSKYNTKPGELALRLHFEAEHSNVLIVTAELLNGCLTTCEVLHMDMSLKQYDEKTVREGGKGGREG